MAANYHQNYRIDDGHYPSDYRIELQMNATHRGYNTANFVSH